MQGETKPCFLSESARKVFVNHSKAETEKTEDVNT